MSEIKNTAFFSLVHSLSTIDSLTGLPNRKNFITHLDNIVSEKKQPKRFAVLFLDLDRFKVINDWYGYEIGDRLLIEAGKRLKGIVEAKGIISRNGEDEFNIILKSLVSKEEVEKITDEIISVFQEPFMIDENLIISNISVGIAFYPEHGEKSYDVMKAADIALNTAKANGKNRAIFYDSSLKSMSDRKLKLENKMYRALENDEFELYYQPQIEIKTGTLIGVEALIRWNSSNMEIISPREFIPLAEENGFIIKIGEWVIREACETIKYLNAKYKKEIKMAVNVSPKQFLSKYFVEYLKGTVEKFQIKSSWIDIEITEESSVKNESILLEKLNLLKKEGFNISIDDFGTGYSSLSYLKKYPVDTLKIALELIRGIEMKEEDFKIVEAIIAMSKSLKLKVIAEGVEKLNQLELLRDLGCNEVQGYYFEKPMRFPELEKKYFIEKAEAL